MICTWPEDDVDPDMPGFMAWLIILVALAATCVICG